MCDSTLFMVSIPIALCTAPNNHATLFVYSTESICLCTISRHITNKTVMIKTVNTMRSGQLATPIPAPSTASVCKYPPTSSYSNSSFSCCFCMDDVGGICFIFIRGSVLYCTSALHSFNYKIFPKNFNTTYNTRHNTTLQLTSYHDP